MWQKLFWLAAGGALGTIARYGLTGLVQRLVDGRWGRAGGTFGGGFVWGTLAVNVLGCFLFGLGWSLSEHAIRIDSPLRIAVFTGFLGAFTTFSTFAFDGSQMLRHGQWLSLAGQVVAHNGLGLAAVGVGFVLGRS